GADLVGVILAAELFALKQRTLIMPAMACFWGMGVISTSLIGFLFRNWRHAQIFISGVSLLSIPLIWILPESARWLTVNRKYKKALRVLQRMAKCNGRPIEDEVVKQYEAAIARKTTEKEKDLETHGSMTIKEKFCGGRKHNKMKTFTVVDIFR
ncbi:unnamed protein product, partial [Owenia fusiformis]